MIGNKIAIGIATVMSLCVATPASTQQYEPSAGGELFEKVQSEFAEAYNRKDIAGMAAFFSENGIRITPAGVFRGRDAIERELRRVVIELGTSRLQRAPYYFTHGRRHGFQRRGMAGQTR